MSYIPIREPGAERLEFSPELGSDGTCFALSVAVALRDGSWLQRVAGILGRDSLTPARPAPQRAQSNGIAPDRDKDAIVTLQRSVGSFGVLGIEISWEIEWQLSSRTDRVVSLDDYRRRHCPL